VISSGRGDVTGRGGLAVGVVVSSWGGQGDGGGDTAGLGVGVPQSSVLGAMRCWRVMSRHRRSAGDIVGSAGDVAALGVGG